MTEIERERLARHAKTRRVKRLLCFAPRRAAFHRYPFVGRFAGLARRRAYLWSFKPKHVRPAIYLGTVLSLWPVMGIQLVLAFVTALFTRCNFMVVGGLQFITNPFTAAPIYYATYRVGRFVLTHTGFGQSSGPGSQSMGDAVTISITANESLPHHVDWTSAFGSTVMALFVGGTICGLILAGVIDLLYVMGWQWQHRKKTVRSLGES